MLESWEDTSELVIYVLVVSCAPEVLPVLCPGRTQQDPWLSPCPCGSGRAPCPLAPGSSCSGAPAPPSPRCHQLLKVQQQLLLVGGGFGSSSATSLWHNSLWGGTAGTPILMLGKGGVWVMLWKSILHSYSIPGEITKTIKRKKSRLGVWSKMYCTTNFIVFHHTIHIYSIEGKKSNGDRKDYV